MNEDSKFKIGIVGVGRVGSTIAYTLLLDGTATELVLFGRDLDKVMGEKLDLEHGLGALDYVAIKATNSYEDLKDCGIIIITAGVAQKPGETRLDLFKTNKAILEEIMGQLNKVAPEAVILIVSNPLDPLVFAANKFASNNRGRIFGSGTLLDTLRLRYYIGSKIGIDPKSIHAYILGEHGDSSFPAYANATIGEQKLMEFPGITKELVDEAYVKTRDSAAEVIKLKGATYYGIAVAVKKFVQTILSDAKTIMPASVVLQGEYGLNNVALSVPCVVGSKGVEKVLEINLSEEEMGKLKESAAKLKKYDVESQDEDF
jgi:L-lactate dehydrogenase